MSSRSYAVPHTSATRPALTRRSFVGATGAGASAIAAALLSGCAAKSTTSSSDSGTIAAAKLASLTRSSLFGHAELTPESEPASPAAERATIEPDLANVTMSQALYLSDEERAKLEDLGFCVRAGYGADEFYEIYESNRYNQVANYVTVDSLMHTYHLYFQYLLKGLERDALRTTLLELSELMAASSADQLDALAGTAYEDAARRNLAFFCVGSLLLGSEARADARVSDQAAEELTRIELAASVDACTLTGKDLDYTQFAPRGYYAGDPALEGYFRAMMWYGQLSFFQADEDLDRSALLMTLALEGDALERWDAIYTITSFFAGASDDNGYFEYRPAIDAAFGADATFEGIADDADGWTSFHELTGQMPVPQINSLVGSSARDQESDRGFRFLGQRFSVDAQVFQQLLYDFIGADAKGQVRLLPDALDVPAAFGSDEALAILDDQGDTGFEGYTESMQTLREEIAGKDDAFWQASLPNQWLHTLQPLLREAQKGTPSFAQSAAWTRRKLEAFLGSYTELKHDTVLYSKQAGAEGGGLFEQDIDDRGYVDPEPLVFQRLANLCLATSSGLEEYGMIAHNEVEDLAILESLALQLADIAVKELTGELPTEDEFELIRSIGVQLEHFWEKVYQEDAEALGSTYVSKWDFPAPVVVDVANGDGMCLELGTSRVRTLFVIVPVEGQLRVACGPCFGFHQFAQPASERLTDEEWRTMLRGAEASASEETEPEAWTSEYVTVW